MAFNVIANLQLQGPTNLAPVINTIQSSFRNIQANVNVTVNPSTAPAVANLNSQIANLQRTLSSVSSTSSSTASSINATATAFNAASTSVSNLGNSAGKGLSALKENVNALNAGTNAADNFGKAAGLAARRYAAFLVAGGAIVQIVQGIQSASSAAITFEREMIKLTQVGAGTAKEIKGIENEVTRLSTSLGVSSSDLIKTSVTLAQAGLNAKQTAQALEALALSALSPNFGNLNDTVEGSIALIQQFRIEAGDLEKALGSMNAVAGAFAVESKDLIEAVKRAGGAFRSTGGDLNEFLGLFTSVRATTRESAEAIATGLRTVFTRLQRQDTVEALQALGVQLRYTRQEATALGNVNLESQFVGPYEAVKRLNEALKEVPGSDPRYSQIIEQLGGYRQISRVLPLIQELTTAQKAYTVAQFGQYSLQTSASQAQEATIVKLEKLKQQFLSLFRTVSESEGFRAFLDITLRLAQGLTKLTEAFTPLIPLLGILATIKGAQSFGGFIGGLNSGLIGGVKSSPIRRATGGLVPGSGDTDTVPAMLTPGEYVIRKSAVQALGMDNLESLNQYASGGNVSKRGRIKFAAGGDVISRERLDEIRQSILRDDKNTNDLIARYTGITGQGVSGAAELREFKQQVGGQEKKFSGLQRGLTPQANGSKTLTLPFPGDTAGMITIGNAADAGIKLITGKTGLSLANQNAQQAASKAGVTDVKAGITVHVLSSGASRQFKEEYSNKIDGAINGLFPADSGVRVNLNNTPEGKQAKNTIAGYLFESFVGGIVGQRPAGSTAGFDFPGNFTSSKNYPRVANHIYPAVAPGELLDAKRVENIRVTSHDIVKKYINYASDNGKLFQNLGVSPVRKNGGGFISGQGTVPAMLTPGEYVVGADSAKQIGVEKLNQLNNTTQKFAYGGVVMNLGQPGDFGGLFLDKPGKGGATAGTNASFPLSRVSSANADSLLKTRERDKIRSALGMPPGVNSTIQLQAGGKGGWLLRDTLLNKSYQTTVPVQLQANPDIHLLDPKQSSTFKNVVNPKISDAAEAGTTDLLSGSGLPYKQAATRSRSAALQIGERSILGFMFESALLGLTNTAQGIANRGVTDRFDIVNANKNKLGSLFSPAPRANYLDVKAGLSSANKSNLIGKAASLAAQGTIKSNIDIANSDLSGIRAAFQAEKTAERTKSRIPLNKNKGGLIPHFAEGGQVPPFNLDRQTLGRVLRTFNKTAGIDYTKLVSKFTFNDIGVPEENKQVAIDAIKSGQITDFPEGSYNRETRQLVLNRKKIKDEQTLRYVLGHELGHAVDYGLGKGKSVAAASTGTAAAIAGDFRTRVEPKIRAKTRSEANLAYRLNPKETFAEAHSYFLEGKLDEPRFPALLAAVPKRVGFNSGGKVPALLTPGEYVMGAGAVSKHGTGLFNSINAKRFATGGSVGNRQTIPVNEVYDTLAPTKLGVASLVALIRDIQEALKALPLALQRSASAIIETGNIKGTPAARLQGFETSYGLAKEPDAPKFAFNDVRTQSPKLRDIYGFADDAGKKTYDLADKTVPPPPVPNLPPRVPASIPNQLNINDIVNKTFEQDIKKYQVNGQVSQQTSEEVLNRARAKVQQDIINVENQELSSKQSRLSRLLGLDNSSEKLRIANERAAAAMLANGTVLVNDTGAIVKHTTAENVLTGATVEAAAKAKAEGVNAGIGNPPPSQTSIRSRLGSIGLIGATFAGSLGADYISRASGRPGDAITADQQSTARRGAGIAGAASTAGIGAAIGSAILPGFGTALGALAGAIAGYTIAVKDADKEIRTTKINNSLNNIREKIDQFTNGVDTSNKSIESIIADISVSRTENSKKAREEATGTFSGFNETEFNETFKKSQRESLGGIAPQMAQLLAKSAEEIGTKTASAGGSGNAGDLVNKFREANNGLNRQLLTTLAGLEGKSLSDIEDRFKKVLTGSFRQDNLKNEERRTTLENEKLYQGFGRLNTAVEAAANSINNLQRVSTLIESAFDSRISGVSFNNLSNIPRGTGDADGFKSSIDQITSQLGAGGSILNDTAVALNNVSRELPNVLTQVLRGNPLEGTGFGIQARESLSNQLTGGDSSKLTGPLKNIIDSVSVRLTREDPDEIRKEGAVDVTKLSAKLLEEFSVVTERIGQLGRDLETNSNRFVDGLVKYANMIEKTGQEQDKVSQLQLEKSKNNAQRLAEQQGRPSQALSLLTLDQQQAPQTTRQRRLTGFDDERAFDPNSIVQAIESNLERQRNVEVRARSEGSRPGAATEEFIKLQQQSVRLTQALQNLTNVSERGASIQERLAKINDDRQSRLNFGEKVATADPEGLAQINRGLGLVVQAANQGSVKNFNNDQRRLVFETLRSLGNAELPGVKGSPVASDLITKLIDELGVFKLAPGKEKERTGLEIGLEKVFDSAIASQEKLVGRQESLQKAFYDNNLKQQEVFFTRLEISLQQDKQSREQINKTRSAIEEKGVTDKIGTVNAFQGVGIKDVNSILTGGGNRKQLDDYLESVKAAQTQRVDVNAAREQIGKDFIAPDIIAKTKGDRGTSYADLPAADYLSNDGERASEIRRQIAERVSGRFGLTEGESTDVASKFSKAAGSFLGAQEGTGLKVGDLNSDLNEILKNQIGRVLENRNFGLIQNVENKAQTLADRTGAPVSQIRGLESGIGGNSFQQLVQGLDKLKIGDTVDSLNKDLAKVQSNAATTATAFNNATQAIEEATGRLNRLQDKDPESVVSNISRAITGGAAISGAPIPFRANGGSIYTSEQGNVVPNVRAPEGYPSRGTDSVLAMLTPGEFVVRREQAQANIGLLNTINKGQGSLAMSEGGLAYLAGGGPAGNSQLQLNLLKLRKDLEIKNQQPQLFIRRKNGPAPIGNAPVPAANPFALPEKVDPEWSAYLKSLSEQQLEFAYRGMTPILANYYKSLQRTSKDKEGTFAVVKSFLDKGFQDKIGTLERLPVGLQSVVRSGIANQQASFQNFDQMPPAQLLNLYTKTVYPYVQNKINTGNRQIYGLNQVLQDETSKANPNLDRINAANSRIESIQQYLSGFDGAIKPDQAKGLNLQPGSPERDNLLKYVKDAYLNLNPVNQLNLDATLRPGQRKLSLDIHGRDIRKFAGGGYVNGYGNTDSVRALLTPGEFVMNKSAVQKIGADNLASMQRFANGGPVGQSNSAGGSGGGFGDMARLIPALTGFSAPAGSLAAALNGFANTANELVSSITKIPTSITMEARHEVVIVVNGLEVLSSLEPNLKNLVIAEVDKQLDRYTEEKFPDVGRRI